MPQPTPAGSEHQGYQAYNALAWITRHAPDLASARDAFGKPSSATHLSDARRAAATDWRQISVLYSELLRFDPSPVIEANRAIAVAMAEGPAAGLTILDIVVADARLKTWPAIHLARADLLRRLERVEDAKRAYLTALELEPPEAERHFIASRLGGL